MSSGDGDVRAILDRNEVEDLVTRYHRFLDAKQWDLLRQLVFAEEIVWDLVADDDTGDMHDAAVGREAFIAWLDQTVGHRTDQHFTTGHLVELHGDRAHSESYLVTLDHVSLATTACGVLYADHVRTGEGWRINRISIVERVATGSVVSMLNRPGYHDPDPSS